GKPAWCYPRGWAANVATAGGALDGKATSVLLVGCGSAECSVRPTCRAGDGTLEEHGSRFRTPTEIHPAGFKAAGQRNRPAVKGRAAGYAVPPNRRDASGKVGR